MVKNGRAVLFVLAGSLMTAAAAASGQELPAPIVGAGEVVLEVQATGIAQAAPDVALLTVGVVSTGNTVGDATAANAAAMAKVLAAVRGAGIDPRFIRTQQISVQPRFARSGPSDYEGQAQITGYVARNVLIITITKPDAAPAVIGAAYEAGANAVSGPNLSLQNDKAALTAARIDGLRRARSAADDYAKGLGMRIVRVVRVSDRGGFANSGDIIVMASRAVGESVPPLSQGEMTQRVTVWVTYALAP